MLLCCGPQGVSIHFHLFVGRQSVCGFGFADAGKTGQIQINHNGDRQRNMTMWAFEPNSTAFSPYINDDLALATTFEPCNTRSLEKPNSGCVSGQVLLGKPPINSIHSAVNNQSLWVGNVNYKPTIQVQQKVDQNENGINTLSAA